MFRPGVTMSNPLYVAPPTAQSTTDTSQTLGALMAVSQQATSPENGLPSAMPVAAAANNNPFGAPAAPSNLSADDTQC